MMRNAYPAFLIFMLFAPLFVFPQDAAYVLSSDSLVNRHASNKRVYQARRTTIRPRIDGKLTDECWLKEGEWQGDFVQQVPNQGRAPSQSTEVKVLYDDANLYVALKCHDTEPEKIDPVLARRDTWSSGDQAGIAIDSYNDKQTAFEFNLTAAGQKIDLMHMGAYSYDLNWDAVWDGKVATGDSMWMAEMRIPFSQLRFSREKEQKWGMHVWRWIARLDEEDQWKLIPIDAPAMVYLFGELQGVKDIPPRKHSEVLPYLALRSFRQGHKKNIIGYGLDGKAALSSNFILDYAVLPDFGQVEADPSVLNLSAYEVFYDEKRPFFLEGNAILDYPIGNDMLFYSRRIGHAPAYHPAIDPEKSTLDMPAATSILNAMKVTGKNRKGFSVGLINSVTARETAGISTEGVRTSQTVEPLSNYLIGRIKQDFNQGNSSVGLMVTSTTRFIKDEALEFLPNSSTVGGADLLHTWKNRMYYIDFKGFASRMNGTATAISRLQLSTCHLYQRVDASHLSFDPAATKMNGWGGELSGGKQSGRFRASGTLSCRSPGVDLNDLGYLKQADQIIQRLDFRYQVIKPSGILNSYYFTLSQRHSLTFGGENTGNLVEILGYVKFRKLWNIRLEMERNFAGLDTRQLRGGPALRIDPGLSSQIYLKTSDNGPFTVGAGVYGYLADGNVARSAGYSLNLQWKVNPRFTVTANNNLERLTDNNQYVATIPNEPARYINGKLNRSTLNSTLRAEYFFTPELSLQYYGSPYLSTGKFLDLYKVTDSRAHNPVKRYSVLKPVSLDAGVFNLDENNDGTGDFTLRNPDFSFREFNSNLVVRWEYLPGSTLYLVWSHKRSGYEREYNPSFQDNLENLWKLKGENVFMLKLSYWLSI